MKRVCEVCGKVEESDVTDAGEQLMSYEIVNVCQSCREHLIHEHEE